MRVLAVDYGMKATGLAICDELQLTVRPLTTIRSGRRAKMAGGRNGQAAVDVTKEVVRYVAEYEVGELVIGMPLNMDGTRGEAARRVDRFIDALREFIDIPIQIIDERLTSREADQILRDSGATRQERRAKSDEYAAVIILEDFLASRQLRRDLRDLPDSE